MNITVSRKDLTFDGLFWFFLIAFLSMLALGMLTRDAKKQFGTLSFGTFPAFHAITQDGQVFDEHKLHGKLWAVVISSAPLPEDINQYLHKLSQSTSMGRKYLTSLVLTNQSGLLSDQRLQYMTVSPGEFQKISEWKKTFKDGVILVDQNAVIRGVFNMEDKLERINFEAAVRGIL